MLRSDKEYRSTEMKHYRAYAPESDEHVLDVEVKLSSDAALVMRQGQALDPALPLTSEESEAYIQACLACPTPTLVLFPSIRARPQMRLLPPGLDIEVLAGGHRISLAKTVYESCRWQGPWYIFFRAYPTGSCQHWFLASM